MIGGYAFRDALERPFDRAFPLSKNVMLADSEGASVARNGWGNRRSLQSLM